MRRLAALATAAALLGSTVGASPASAHAYLAASDPSDGQSLQSAPTRISLQFTEHVVLESTTVQVVDSRGRRVATGPLTLEESDEDREAPATVIAPLPPLGQGAYRVAWRTLSSDDLHESAGVITFGVGQAVEAAGPSDSPVDPLDAAGRWAVLTAIAAALGAAVLTRLLRGVRGAAERRRLQGRVHWFAARWVAAGLVASLVVGALDVSRFGWGAASGGYAGRWTLRETLLAVAAAALLTRRRPSLASSIAALAAIAASAVTTTMGHTGVVAGPTWFLASTVHVVAALGWAGTVALLAWLVARAPALGTTRAAARPVLKRFRPYAVPAVGAALATGIYLSGDAVVSVDAALLTTYGRVLLLKGAVVLVLGVVAFGTTRAVHGRGHVAPRRLAVEATLLTAVVVLGGVLASGQPAVAPQLVAADTPSVIDDRQVGDLQQTLTLGPNRPGHTIALVDVLDTRRPSPGPVSGVTVAVTGGVPTPAEAVSPSRWSASVVLPATERVSITVVVHRRGAPDVRSTLPWVVDVATARPAVVSRAALVGPLRALALLVGAGFIVAAVVVLRRRVPERRPQEQSRTPKPSSPPDEDMGEAGSSPAVVSSVGAATSDSARAAP